MVPEPRKTPANRGRQQPLTTSVMILQLLDRKMVKRNPSSVYFALIPLVVILFQFSVLVYKVRQVQLGVLELKHDVIQMGHSIRELQERIEFLYEKP